MSAKQIGDVILDVKNISLSFGGVKALTDISFDVREHEVRAIIGPNGAGKSSMLNCINGVYTPQQGTIAFRGQTFDHMDSHQVAVMGIARTFQNLALVDALYGGATTQFIETLVKFEDGRTGSVSATLRIDDAKTFAPVKAAA
jgi:ABC-type branched-subunit amino acid transport system ATPase component